MRRSDRQPTESDDPAAALGVAATLRDGDRRAPLFMFPGAGGDPGELAGLAAAITDPAAVVGVRTCGPDAHGRYASTIGQMACAGAAAIRAVQPRGPYRLVGYSFGSVVAVEIARILRDGDDGAIALLAMIDPVFDQRYWPAGLWLRAQAAIVVRHLRALLQTRPGQVPSLLGRRIQGLARRLRNRVAARPAAPTTGSDPDATKARGLAAMSGFRPVAYPGRIDLFRSTLGDEFGCDLSVLWRRLASSVEVHEISSDHLSVVRQPAPLRQIAREIDRLLGAASSTA
jgi:acetoacetyl-CoA synthetase